MQAGEQELDHISLSYKLKKAKKHFAKELLRQLNVVTIQDPGLAQYVQIVNIEVNAATFRPVFDELGRCFSLFPNLQTVKIITRFLVHTLTDGVAMRAAKRSFKTKFPYPQIRSAILSPSVYLLLAACPNLESLTVSKECPLLLTFMQGLPVLQQLLCPLSLTSAAAIAEHLASLQIIMISLEESTNYTEEDYTTYLIKTIQLFPNLKTLVFSCRLYILDRPCTSVESLKQAFLDLQPRDRQNLKVLIFLFGRAEKVVLSEF